MMNNDMVWMDGPMHPDLFDEETPIRLPVNLEDVGLKVYKVNCTYYIQEEQTHYVVAKDPVQAEDIAWDKVCEEQTSLDEAEVEEMDLDETLRAFGYRGPDTARELLQQHFEEHPEACSLTQN